MKKISANASGDVWVTEDLGVLVDFDDPQYPIAIHGADWWMTKTEVADLITALTKALQAAP